MQKFYVLGTCAGISDIGFTLSGVLQHNDKCLLVDTGEGMQVLKQLRLSGIKISNIHDVFISHKHIDHLLGLIPFIRKVLTSIKIGEYEGVLNIYCDIEIKEIVDYIIKATFQDTFQELYKEKIKFFILENGQEYNVIGYKMRVLDTYSKASVQFGFEIILEDNKRLFYLGDVPCATQNYERVKNADWVLHEAFSTSPKNKYTELIKSHHSNVADVCKDMNQLNVKNLVLWHTLDDNIETRKERFLTEGKEYFDGNLYVPDDLEVIDLDV